MQKTLSFSWASSLIKECYKQGVRDAVLSPGSRNTSLVLALTHFPGIRCVAVIDERSAGFIALGMSKVSKRPTLLCCTSGTAGANYYPAIIEAYQSSIPLVALTADRPAHLQQVGASQTIQQKNLFGSHVLDFIQLPEIDNNNKKQLLSNGKKEFSRAIQLAYSGGPVHVNAPFNKPFEPTLVQFNEYIKDSKILVLKAEKNISSSEPDLPTHRMVRPELVGIPTKTKVISSTVEANLSSVDDPLHHSHLSKEVKRIINPMQLQNLYSEMHRPLIFIGSDPTPFQWFRLLPKLAKHPNARIILEAGASLYGWDFEELNLVNSKVILGWEKLLYNSKNLTSSPFNSFDGIIRLGKEALNLSLARFFSEHKHLTQLRFMTHEPYEDVIASQPYFITPEVAFSWVDLQNKHTQVIFKKWHNALDELNKEYLEQLAQHFIQGKNDTLTDGAVFYRLSKILPSSTPIFLSNSYPVRDQALFAPMWAVDNPLISQRGAAGIDGISSTALGVSLSCQLPTAVLTGDIAFLYDINALLSAKLITKPLVIFIINNGGGSIFSSLPVKKAAPDSMDWFITPQQVSIEYLARSYGLNYSKIVNLNQLWENDWAEQIQELLRLHTSSHSSTFVEDEKYNGGPEKINHAFPMSINSASNVRIIEFITNSEVSIAERNDFRR